MDSDFLFRISSESKLTLECYQKYGWWLHLVKQPVNNWYRSWGKHLVSFFNKILTSRPIYGFLPNRLIRSSPSCESVVLAPILRVPHPPSLNRFKTVITTHIFVGTYWRAISSKTLRFSFTSRIRWSPHLWPAGHPRSRSRARTVRLIWLNTFISLHKKLVMQLLNFLQIELVTFLFSSHPNFY